MINHHQVSCLSSSWVSSRYSSPAKSLKFIIINNAFFWIVLKHEFKLGINVMGLFLSGPFLNLNSASSFSKWVNLVTEGNEILLRTWNFLVALKLCKWNKWGRCPFLSWKQSWYFWDVRLSKGRSTRIKGSPKYLVMSSQQKWVTLRRDFYNSKHVFQNTGRFLHWASPKKWKYGKPRLGEST